MCCYEHRISSVTVWRICFSFPTVVAVKEEAGGASVSVSDLCEAASLIRCCFNVVCVFSAEWSSMRLILTCRRSERWSMIWSRTWTATVSENRHTWAAAGQRSLWLTAHRHYKAVYSYEKHELLSNEVLSVCLSVAKKIDELQEILKKKDEDMRRMEERYKRYVDKARTVSLTSGWCRKITYIYTHR